MTPAVKRYLLECLKAKASKPQLVRPVKEPQEPPRVIRMAARVDA